MIINFVPVITYAVNFSALVFLDYSEVIRDDVVWISAFNMADSVKCSMVLAYCFESLRDLSSSAYCSKYVFHDVSSFF